MKHDGNKLSVWSMKLKHSEAGHGPTSTHIQTHMHIIHYSLKLTFTNVQPREDMEMVPSFRHIQVIQLEEKTNEKEVNQQSASR